LQAICFCLHVAILHLQITVSMNAYNSFSDKKTTYVINSFRFANDIGSSSLVLLFFKIVWFGRQDLLRIISFSAVWKHKNAKLIYKIGMFIGIIWFVVYCVIMITAYSMYDPLQVDNLASSNQSNDFYCTNLENICKFPFNKLIYLVKAAVALHSSYIHVITHSLVFVLSCCLLGMACQFDNDLQMALIGQDRYKVGIQSFIRFKRIYVWKFLRHFD